MTETKSSTPKEAAPATPGATPVNGLAIASLVTGIVAFVFGWAIFFGFLVGATAVVLGIIGIKKARGNGTSKGLSVAGIVTGAIGALWSLVLTILFVVSLVLLGIGGASAGVALDQANKALENYNAENKALIEAKKDFKRGETAKFGQFEVKVNSLQRDYDASDSYYAASEGNELIVVNVTVKNVGKESKYIGLYDLKMNDAGVADTSAFIDVAPAFESGDVDPNASVTGNLVYEVKKGSTDLKLQYEVYAYDLNGGGAKTLTFTLEV